MTHRVNFFCLPSLFQSSDVNVPNRSSSFSQNPVHGEEVCQRACLEKRKRETHGICEKSRSYASSIALITRWFFERANAGGSWRSCVPHNATRYHAQHAIKPLENMSQPVARMALWQSHRKRANHHRASRGKRENTLLVRRLFPRMNRLGG